MNQVQNISFHGQTVAVFSQNNQHYVAMKPIVENIGLDWVSQHKKIQRNEILNSTMVMMTIVAEDGKKREMLCLPLDYLNGWLFGVDAQRVKPEIRERLLTYQRECFRVLNDHFNRATPSVKDQLPTRDELIQVIYMLGDRLREIHGWGWGNFDDHLSGKFNKTPRESTYGELVHIIRWLHKQTQTIAGRPIVAGVNCPVKPFGLGASLSQQAESLPAMLAAEEKKQLPVPVVVKAADSSDAQCRKREIAESHKSAIARLLTYDGDTSEIGLAECAAVNEIINLSRVVSDAYENFMFSNENQNLTDEDFKCAMLELARLKNTVMELSCC